MMTPTLLASGSRKIETSVTRRRVIAGLALLIVAGAMVFMFSKNDTI